MLKLFKSLFVVATLLFLISAAFAQDEVSAGKTEWDHGILIHKTSNGDFWTRFDTRGYLNGAYFFEDGDHLSNGTHVRKARFALKTQLWKYWYAEWDINVAKGAVEIKDMFIAFFGMDNSHIKLGHFKMPLGLEELTTSRYLTFIERAYPMLAFEPDRHMGLEYSRWGYHWNLRAAIYGQTMDNVKNKNRDETGSGAAARLVFAPIRNSNMILHTGLAMVYQKPDDGSDAMEFQSEAETKIGDAEILSTGTIFDIHHSLKTGFEGVLVYRNFSLQGEYVRTDLSRMNGAKDAMLDGSYAFISWLLTGESRPWIEEQGEFGQIIPKSNKIGAWEVALRYSHLNLSDDNAGITGGKANNYTLGLNWYANPNIRFLLNYTYVDNSIFATNDGFPGDYDFSVVHFMALYFF